MSAKLRAQIHIACKELGLDQAARRDLQLVETGKASMSDMTDADMHKLLDRLKRDGFSADKKPFKPAPRGDLRVVHVLWRKLGEAGAVRARGRAGLNAFVKERFGTAWGYVPVDVDHLTDKQHIDQLLQALRQMGKRAGIDFDWGRHR